MLLVVSGPKAQTISCNGSNRYHKVGNLYSGVWDLALLLSDRENGANRKASHSWQSEAVTPIVVYLVTAFFLLMILLHELQKTGELSSSQLKSFSKMLILTPGN
jgi:succinate dehydrogenase hydrophobic anchor subunit